MSVAVEDGDVFVDVQGQGRTAARPTSDSTLEIATVSAEFTFDFDADGTTSTGTLVQSGLEISMRRVDRAELAEEALAAFVGRYYSEELETFYEVAVEDGGLVLHHIEMAEPLAMQHTDGDEFSTEVIFPQHHRVRALRERRRDRFYGVERPDEGGAVREDVRGAAASLDLVPKRLRNVSPKPTRPPETEGRFPRKLPAGHPPVDAGAVLRRRPGRDRTMAARCVSRATRRPRPPCPAGESLSRRSTARR